MVAVHLMQSYCLSSLLYACETWSLTNNSAHSANVALNNSFRRIFNCCCRESPKLLLYYCRTLPIVPASTCPTSLYLATPLEFYPRRRGWPYLNLGQKPAKAMQNGKGTVECGSKMGLCREGKGGDAIRGVYHPRSEM